MNKSQTQTQTQSQSQFLSVPNTKNHDHDKVIKCEEQSSNGSFTAHMSTDDGTIEHGYSSAMTNTQSNGSSQYQQNIVQSDMDIDDVDDTKEITQYDPRNTMMKHGYIPINVLSKTLQGCVYRAKYLQTDDIVVIKITNKVLMTNKIAIDRVTGKRSHVQENIKKEINMMHRLNMHNPAPGMIKMHTVFEDNTNIFVVMEYGGHDMLNFINRCHEEIKQGKISLYDWQQTSKLMHKQIIKFVQWLHLQRVCHLDISLENMLISHVEWIEDAQNGSKKLKPTFEIKFCDFGLSEYYNVTDTFLSCKFVGKLRYQCPKIYTRNMYDARYADIWSVGVCALMISLGTAPWERPDSQKDIKYHYIVMKQKLFDVLKHWNRAHYVEANFVDLCNKIFVDESGRIPINCILKHPWLANE